MQRSEIRQKLNDIFANTGIDIKSYSICDGIDENIQKWDEGEAMGIPFDGLPHFSEMIGGIPDAGVSLIGGVSNVGKSTVVRNCILPILFPWVSGSSVFWHLAYWHLSF